MGDPTIPGLPAEPRIAHDNWHGIGSEGTEQQNTARREARAASRERTGPRRKPHDQQRASPPRRAHEARRGCESGRTDIRARQEPKARQKAPTPVEEEGGQGRREEARVRTTQARERQSNRQTGTDEGKPAYPDRQRTQLIGNRRQNRVQGQTVPQTNSGCGRGAE